MKRILIALFSLVSFTLFAQDDLLKMLDTVGTSDKSVNRVTATFKTTKIISMQTPQTMGAGELDFRITHRFGNIGGGSGGGIHSLYGWDAISDVRFSFDYGITRTFQVGFARNKKNENLDGSLKWRFLEQTLDGTVPFSICAYTIAALTPMNESQIYAGADAKWIDANKRFAHKMVYTTQLVIARKASKWFSFAITPTYTHRNYVLDNINPDNGEHDMNDLYSVGTGVRLKVSRSVSLLADYFYTVSKFRRKNPTIPYYNPLAVGIEIETGGHVFHMNFTNAAGITETYFIPNSPDTWGKGGYKFGFNISRVFQITSKVKKDKK